MAEPDQSPDRQVLSLLQGGLVTQIVGTAAKLKVADQVAAGPKTADEIATATGIHPELAPRFLRACVAAGLLTETPDGRFAGTSRAEPLRADGGSLRSLAVTAISPGFWLPAGHLAEALRTGHAAAESALGMTLYEYYRKNPAEGAYYDAAMGESTELAAAEIASLFDLTGFTRIVDVGGSQGAQLTALLSAAPGAAGVLFDRPEVIGDASSRFAAQGVADRIEVVAGSFFDEVPSGGDLYVLKAVLSDWLDDDAATILRNCHRAAAPDSTLLVVDQVRARDTEISAYIYDMLTLTICGGRVRSRAEYQTLLSDAGYRVEQVIDAPSNTLFAARKD